MGGSTSGSYSDTILLAISGPTVSQKISVYYSSNSRTSKKGRYRLFLKFFLFHSFINSK